MKPTQLSLIPVKKPEHGGELNLGKRKELRPLATDRPVHLVLKAERFFGYEEADFMRAEIRRLGARFGILILDIATKHDHIHALLKIPHRREYAKFIRSLTGLLARKFGKGFWSQVPYTRVGSWGREYEALRRYLEKNRRATEGPFL